MITEAIRESEEEVQPQSGPDASTPVPSPPQRWRVFVACGLVILILGSYALRFRDLTADMPWWITPCGALLTDEGLYACNSIFQHQSGVWRVDGAFNPIINLPVHQTLQIVAFKLLGYGIKTLRLMTVFFQFLTIPMVILLVRRYESWLVALLAGAIMSVNHYYFAYSRFSIADIPMGFFLMASFVAAAYANGKKQYWMAALSAALFVTTLLTKTSAAFAGPVLGIFLLLNDFKLPFREWNWKPVLIRGAVFGVVFVGLIGLDYLFIIKPYIIDYKYFNSTNVNVTSSLNPVQLKDNSLWILEYSANIDRLLHAIFIPLTIVMLILSKSYRREPLVWVTLFYLGFYILEFAVYGRFYPRFFHTMIPAIAIWAAITTRHAFFSEPLRLPWRNLRRFSIPRQLPGVAMVLVLLISLGWNAKVIYKYMTSIDYSYHNAAVDMKKIMDSDPTANKVMLGQLALTIALHDEEVIPMTDRYSQDPLGERLDRINPSWMISEGEQELYPLEGWYSHREAILKRYDLELLKVYPVYNHYKGYDIAFYRLHPKKNKDVN